jgi:hypothetical protein
MRASLGFEQDCSNMGAKKVDQELLGQILIIFAQTKLFGDGTGILCTSVWFLDELEIVCGMSISNAILWTHFVTPHGNQTQQDQTTWVSYHKKEESEELDDDSSHSDLVGLYTLM